MLTSLVTLTVALLLVARTSYAQSYVAEGLFVVDDETVQKYIDEIPGSGTASSKRVLAEVHLNTDINYILTEVNHMFGTLAPHGLNVQIKITDIVFLTSNIFSSNDYIAPGVVNAPTGLQTFASWLGTQSYGSPDFAILWTGFDLTGSSGRATASFSLSGGVCDQDYNQGVVEFNATYETVVLTANRIAYILGAGQDGAGSSNIMAFSHNADNENRWDFTSCSASAISEYFGLLNDNCLLSTSSSSTTPSLSFASYSGKLFDADAVCRRSEGNVNSYFCRNINIYPEGAPHGDEVCQKIYCLRPNTDTCYSSYPSDGMICENSKRCNDGQCIPDSSTASSNVDDDCVFGDQPEVSFSNPDFEGTCGNLLAQYGNGMCYSDAVYSVCCDSCNAVPDGGANCRYGDRSTECTNYPKAQVCPNNMEVCCGYCSGFKRKRSAMADRGHMVIFKDIIIKVKGAKGNKTHSGHN